MAVAGSPNSAQEVCSSLLTKAGGAENLNQVHKIDLPKRSQESEWARQFIVGETEAVARGEAYIHPLLLKGFRPLPWAADFRSGAASAPLSTERAAPAQPEPASSEAKRNWAFLQEKYSLLAPEEARQHPLSLTRLEGWMDPTTGGLRLLGQSLVDSDMNAAKAFSGWRQQLFEALGLQTENLKAETLKKFRLLETQSSPLALQKEDFAVARDGRGWSQRLAAARIFTHLVSLRNIILDEAQGLMQEGDVLDGELEYLQALAAVDLATAQGLEQFLAYFNERVERMVEEFLDTQELLLVVDRDLESLTREAFRPEHEQLMVDKLELEERLSSLQDDVLDGRPAAARELHRITFRVHNLHEAIADWDQLLRPKAVDQDQKAYADTFEQLLEGDFFPRPDYVYSVDHELFPKMNGIETVVFLKPFVRKMSHLVLDDLKKVNTLFSHMTSGFVAEQGQSGVKHHLPSAHKQFVLVKHKGGGGRHRLLGGFVDGRLILVDMRLNEDPPASGYSSISKVVCRMARDSGYNCNPD